MSSKIPRFSAMFRLLPVLGLWFGLGSQLCAQVADDPVTVPVQFQGLYNADATGDSSNPATVSISPNGTNFAYGSSAGGTDQLTTNGFGRLRPGRTYLFTIQTFYLTRLRVKITAPAGYRVFINRVEHEMFDWQMGNPAQHLDATGAFSVRLDDGSGAPVGEAASLRPGRVLWSVGLGNLRNGKPAGSIVMAENGLTANTYKPDALYYDRDGTAANSQGDEGEVETIKVGNILRQVYAQTALVDVVAAGDHACYLRFYPRDTGQIGVKTNGLYPVSGTPLYEYLIENPTYPALNALRITKTTNQNGQLVTWTEMRKQPGEPNQWVIQDWADNTVSTSPVQHRWTYSDSDRTELMEVMGNNGVVYKSLKLYADINFGTETSRELVSETVGEAPTEVTTTYSYYTDPAVPGDWHRIKNITSSGGSWTAFNYCNEFFMRGQIKEVRRPHKNAPDSDPGFNGATGERTTYTYDFQDCFGTNKLPTRIETAIDAIITARTEIDYSYETFTDQSADYLSTGSAQMTLTVATRRDFFNTTQYLTTIAKSFREDSDDDFRFFPGLPYSIQRPDKTMSVNLYFHTAFAGSSYTLLRAGEGRETLTVNGTSDTSVGVSPSYSLTQSVPSNFRVVAGKSSSSAIFYGGLGVVAIAEQSVYANDSQWVATRQDWPTYTNSFYPSQVAHRASYAGVTWLVANNTWTNGRLSAAVDETGVRKTFSYDAVGRPQTVSRDSAYALSTTISVLTTTSAYDAAGRVTSQTVASPGYFDSITSSRTYDRAGRVLTETAPGSGTTTYAYNPASRTVTVTLPTGSTRVESMYLDGRTYSSEGTAMVPGYSDFSIASDGTRYSKTSALTPTGSRNRETWTDWLGRPQTTRQPGFTGQPTVDEQMTYDATTGQLRRTLRTGFTSVRYEYNAMGEAVRSGLDLDDQGLVPASTDRITDADTSAESYDGAHWLTSRTWSYPIAGDPARKLMGTVRKRLTGLTDSLRSETRSFDAEGNETRQTVTVDSANKLVTSTTTRPGLASAQTEVALNGLPISSTGHDGLTYTRNYDAIARPTTVTDPRAGTVTTSYWGGTALPYETRDAANKRLSYTEYDGAGRPFVTYDAMKKTTRVAYNARGQVEYQWGSASYPVSYVYDSFGQRTKLRTYQGGDSSSWENSGWPGGAVASSETTWEFDDPSGLLKRKYDPSGSFVEYAYNNRGQTSQRFWSRTVGGQRVYATYGYDGSTGELTSVAYSDGTPGVGYTYNRLGQTATATDYTGTRSFAYDPTSPWRLSGETLPGFYGSRVLSRTYDGGTTTNTGDGSYTGHTIGTVLGRYSGYRLGTSGAPAADLELTYATSSAGRLAGQVSRRGNGASSRQFVYGYEANSALLKTLSVVGDAFYVDRGFEPNRDLLTRIESRWSGAVRTKFEYAYDDRRQRQSVVQSGDVYGDYGDSIHQIFNYNPRGELTSAGTYMGGSPTSTAPLMKARMHEFDYDSIGNRKTSNTSGVVDLAEHYTPNTLNQYTSRENNTLSAGGVVDAGAKVVAGSNASVLAGRAGRHWGDNVIVSNTSQPFYGSIPVYSALIGGAPGGKDLFRVESKLGFLAKALQNFTYDADGNMTSDGVWDYQWDAENRLIHMATTDLAASGGMPRRIMDFRYDYRNRRVLKNVSDGGGTLLSQRRLIYDGPNLIAELDAGAALKRSYSWGLDLAGSLGATGGVGALLQIYDHDLGKTFFPTFDGNGNIASLINADTGGMEAAYEYSPFGELLRCEGGYAKENPFRFSTKFTDQESGLVDYGARFYNAREGRFINRDPIGEQGGLNVYGFCGNDGVNGIDYMGYSWLSSWRKLRSKLIGVSKYFDPALNTTLRSDAYFDRYADRNPWFRQVAIMVASYYTGGLASGWAETAGWGAIASVSVGGATASATSATLSDRSGADILKAALIAGAAAGLGEFVAPYMLSYTPQSLRLSSAKYDFVNKIQRNFYNGFVVGAVQSSFDGGNVLRGAIEAGLKRAAIGAARDAADEAYTRFARAYVGSKYAEYYANKVADGLASAPDAIAAASGGNFIDKYQAAVDAYGGVAVNGAAVFVYGSAALENGVRALQLSGGLVGGVIGAGVGYLVSGSATGTAAGFLGGVYAGIRTSGLGGKGITRSSDGASGDIDVVPYFLAVPINRFRFTGHCEFEPFKFDYKIGLK